MVWACCASADRRKKADDSSILQVMDDDPVQFDEPRTIIPLALVIAFIAFAATTLWWVGA